jgi:hypothetical protein
VSPSVPQVVRSLTSYLLYSRLLLGVDETKKEIACGLVDTIGAFLKLIPPAGVSNPALPGSYTFAKTLEYKAKNGLQPGKEVTVLPPADYQERFVKTLEGYFVACPGMLHLPSSRFCHGSILSFRLRRQMVETAGRVYDDK